MSAKPVSAATSIDTMLRVYHQATPTSARARSEFLCESQVAVMKALRVLLKRRP